MRAAGVVFKDAAGAVLARGRVEAPLGVFSIDHPTVGDCRAEEREAFRSPAGMSAWQRCFETQSRWLTTWVPRIRSAEVNLGNCRIDRTPVSLQKFGDDWWLWWVPVAHVGGPPYTSFQASLWIDSANCRPSAGER